ncbi:hypothetical protein [Aquimarina rhabdastrellae]
MKEKIFNLEGVIKLNRHEQKQIFAGRQSCRTHRDCIVRDDNGQVLEVGICMMYRPPYFGVCEY